MELWEFFSQLQAALISDSLKSTKRANSYRVQHTLMPASSSVQLLMMPSEMAGPQAVIRLVWPIALAGLGVLPVILGRNVVERGDDLIGVVAPAFLAVALLAALIITWIRVRDDVMTAAATGAGR